MIKAYGLVVAFFLVLLTPYVLHVAVSKKAEANRPVYTDRLVILTPHNQDIRREFAAAFADWHSKKYGSGVEIDYRTPGGTNDIARVLSTTYGSMRGKDKSLPPEEKVDPPADLVWGGGDFFFDVQLKPLGILQPLQLDPEMLARAFPHKTLAGVKLIESSTDKAGNPLPPRWVGVCLSSFGIVYNPDVYAGLGLPAPTTWSDLANEKLAGMTALADPTHSGSSAVAYMMVMQRNMADEEEALFAKQPALKSASKAELAKSADYQTAIGRGWKKGMSELLLIAANACYLTASAEQVPTDVGNGEAAAGMSIDFYGRVESETVGASRAVFFAPVAATAVTPDPIAILYGVKNRQQTLANHFVEFLLSDQGQLLWTQRVGTPGGPSRRALRRPPIRPDLYADRKLWSDDINPFQETGGFNQRGDWMGQYNDIRTIWSAAWIDSRDNLVSAYRTVLTEPDPARRAALVAKLADLPIEMKDLDAQIAERKKIEAAGSSDEWKAVQRIVWAKKFRQHYAEVAAQKR